MERGIVILLTLPGIDTVGHPPNQLEKVSAFSVALMSTSLSEDLLCNRSLRMISRKSVFYRCRL